MRESGSGVKSEDAGRRGKRAGGSDAEPVSPRRAQGDGQRQLEAMMVRALLQ